jgi:hypothetical protein
MIALQEQDLPRYGFQSDEAVLLCDHAHAEFVARHGNASLRDATVVALTAAAHGTALRVGLDRVVAPYDLAGYGAFIGQDYGYYATLCKTWLGELSLALTIEGINLGEFDALYQYWFFEYATYIAGIAAAIFEAFPDHARFFVPVGESFLPAELFLDTDVAAAVVRHVGESQGRTMVPIVMRNRPLHFAAWTDRRPFMEPVPTVSRQRGAPEQESRYRIGVVPAAMHRYDRLAKALNAIPSEVLVFDSAWARDGGAEEVDLPPPDWQARVEQTLESYWQAFLSRRDGSSLPDSIIRNAYLEPQFAYIIKTRWLVYARYIYMAAHFAAQNPLDLFIHCDHFTGEGTILSHLYRQRGTRIAVAQHSPHFNDTPYAPWQRSDIALVTTGFAEILARRAGLSRVYHVGYSLYGDPLEDPVPRTLEKPVVLFMANATEVQFPLLDIRAMLDALSVLAAPPAHLKDKVAVAVRLKPGIFAEDPLIFEQVCGLPEKTTREGMAMSLKQCLDGADCVVGIGLSTSGYLEVIDRGKPLIHVDTALAHPMCRYDFIPAGIGRVTANEGIWREVEAVLFDPDHRARLLAAQHDYIERDKTPSLSGPGDLLVAALTDILSTLGAPP